MGGHIILVKGSVRLPGLEKYLCEGLQCLHTGEWKDFSIQTPCEKHQAVF